MLDLDVIATVNWSPKYGEALRRIRGDLTMQAIAKEVTERYNYPVTKQYINMLEKPFTEKASKTVSFQLLRYICEVANGDICDIFGSPKIFQKQQSDA